MAGVYGYLCACGKIMRRDLSREEGSPVEPRALPMRKASDPTHYLPTAEEILKQFRSSSISI